MLCSSFVVVRGRTAIRPRGRREYWCVCVSKTRVHAQVRGYSIRPRSRRRRRQTRFSALPPQFAWRPAAASAPGAEARAASTSATICSRSRSPRTTFFLTGSASASIKARSLLSAPGRPPSKRSSVASGMEPHPSHISERRTAATGFSVQQHEVVSAQPEHSAQQRWRAQELQPRDHLARGGRRLPVAAGHFLDLFVQADGAQLLALGGHVVHLVDDVRWPIRLVLLTARTSAAASSYRFPMKVSMMGPGRSAPAGSGSGTSNTRTLSRKSSVSKQWSVGAASLGCSTTRFTFSFPRLALLVRPTVSREPGISNEALDRRDWSSLGSLLASGARSEG